VAGVRGRGGAALIPGAIGIAIFRYHLYHLYDIGVVINKTLVYGSLAAFIIAVYDAGQQRLAQHQQAQHPHGDRGARGQHGPARGAHRGHRRPRRFRTARSASRNLVTMNSA
jgi:hypothetical protein